MKDLEIRLNKLRQFNRTLYGSHDDDLIDITTKNRNALKHDTIELIANQIYDKLTISFNDTRKILGIKKGIPIAEPIRKYDNFDLEDDGTLSYISKKTVIDLGNINERLKSPWEIHKLGVSKMRLMGFTNITDEDINPYRPKYKIAREKLKKLDGASNEKSKAIGSLSTTDTEAIEMIVMTSKDIDTTIKDVEQDTSFIKPDDRDKLLPLGELE